jgi:hypothetical protein
MNYGTLVPVPGQGDTPLRPAVTVSSFSLGSFPSIDLFVSLPHPFLSFYHDICTRARIAQSVLR